MNLEFFPLFYQTIAPTLGYIPYDEVKEKTTFEKLHKICQIIEHSLGQHGYLVGKSVTIADIYFLSVFHYFFRYNLDESFRVKYPNLVKWFVNLANHNNFI